jgi:hypothetical protein
MINLFVWKMDDDRIFLDLFCHDLSFVVVVIAVVIVVVLIYQDPLLMNPLLLLLQ